MDASTYILKLVLVQIIYLASVTECRYWNVSQIRLDPNIDSIVGTSEAHTVLSCSRYCEKPWYGSVAFFFNEENHQCYCGNKHDTRSEDPAADPILYGHTHGRCPSRDNGPFRRDCLEYHREGCTIDGLYKLEATPGPNTTAWCDMENGGWTVIQRRRDGSVDFFRNWTEYVRGFGDPGGEYWIGLDNIHYLTQEPAELHIYLETFGDVTPVAGYAWYSRISVANSSLLYRLSIETDNYRGTVSDSMNTLDGMYFSTYDNDNDIDDDVNCASDSSAGWWYKFCFRADLNALYGTGVIWAFPWGDNYSLKTVIMKVRRL